MSIEVLSLYEGKTMSVFDEMSSEHCDDCYDCDTDSDHSCDGCDCHRDY